MAAHFLLLIAFLLPSFAGDKVEILLKTGKTVTGELLKDGDEELILSTDLGTLLIKKSSIKSQKVLGKPAAKPVSPKKTEPKKPDPFELKKIVADIEARAKAAENEKPAADKASAKTGANPEVKTAGAEAKPQVAVRTATTDGSVESPHKKGHGALYNGRIIDRFPWANQVETGTKLSIFAAMFLLFWGSICVLTRLLDVENSSTGKSAAAGLIWVALIVGMLLVPNPTQVILGIVGFCTFVAWLMTTRGILGATWVQSIYLFMLGSLGVLLLYLLVEVGSNILELQAL